MASNIQIEIAADVKKAVQGIESVVQRLDQMDKATEKNKKSLATLAINFSAITSAVSFLYRGLERVSGMVKSCTDAYTLSEKALTKFQSAARAAGIAGTLTATEYIELATSLQRVTTYSDEAILSVEQMLISTQRISRETMPEATESVLDMASALGEDAVSAARRLAKVLADPKANLDALKDANIQLTDEQKDNIKQLQEQNDLLGAQEIVLKAVKDVYGGMAKALADTDAGKLTQIANVWEDIKSGLGEGLLNKIGPALDWLYERLLDISEWTNDINTTGRIENAVRKADGGTPDFSEYSDVDLISALNAKQLSSGGYQYDQAADVASAIIKELDARLVDYPGYEGNLSDNSRNIRAWALEMSERNPVGQFLLGNSNSPLTQDELINNNLGYKFSEQDLLYYNHYQQLLSQIDNSRSSGRHAPSDQSPASIARQSGIGTWRDVDINEGGSVNDISQFLSQNSNYSSSFQLDSIQSRIDEAKSLLSDATSDQSRYISEIISGLEEEKKKLTDVNDAAEEGSSKLMDWQKSLSDAMPAIDTAINYATEALSAFSDLFSQLMDNQITALENALEECTEKWDEYLSNLEDNQNKQRDSLNAQLAAGLISQEDYVSAMEDLDEEMAESKEAAAAEEEDLQKEADELKKKQFEAEKANNIANSLINGAVAITRLWSSHDPITAGVLSAVVTGITAAEVATISSQQYTPLAAGGITTGPTHALIGEAGYPEMVLPLTDSNLQKVGLSQLGNSGVIQIVVNINGPTSDGESLEETVYMAIERAQRTGVLPHWSYV